MSKINNLAMHPIFWIIYYFVLNKCQVNRLYINFVKEINVEEGNLISHSKNLETNDNSKINIDNDEIFMI